MTNSEAISARHAELRRAQRNAYFAWQNTPAGAQGGEMEAYLSASKELENFNASVRG